MTPGAIPSVDFAMLGISQSNTTRKRRENVREKNRKNRKREIGKANNRVHILECVALTHSSTTSLMANYSGPEPSFFAYRC